MLDFNPKPELSCPGIVAAEYPLGAAVIVCVVIATAV
jgi:hypothetical protein